MRGSGQVLAVAALAGLLLAAWTLWDGPRERASEHSSLGDARLGLVACPADAALVDEDAFRLGGQVVRSSRWCGAHHVDVDVSAELEEHEYMIVVVASSVASTTLTLPHAGSTMVAIGPDGWLAVGIVQADERALARGGAWFRLTAGAPPR